MTTEMVEGVRPVNPRPTKPTYRPPPPPVAVVQKQIYEEPVQVVQEEIAEEEEYEIVDEEQYEQPVIYEERSRSITIGSNRSNRSTQWQEEPLPAGVTGSWPPSHQVEISPKEAKKKKSLSFFKGKSKKKEVERLVISEPVGFRHPSSIGWNASTGQFDIRNIPTEWRKLFQRAGITAAQLQDKNTAAFVKNVIVKYQEDNNNLESNSPPTPPPLPPTYSSSSHPLEVESFDYKQLSPLMGLEDTLTVAMNYRRGRIAVHGLDEEYEEDDWEEPLESDIDHLERVLEEVDDRNLSEY